jgi:ATP-dependent helicase/nuclease subunit B
LGEINEVREVFRRCLAEGVSCDDVEVLHTDTETYISLIYATAQRYFSAADRPDGVPVTFAEGLPVSLSRPGRALAAWLRWIEEGYPQRLLVEMLGEGLLACDGDDEFGFQQLARLLRPLTIGARAENYLPKIEARIKTLQEPPPRTSDGDAGRAAAQERELRGLKLLRKCIALLLKWSLDLEQDHVL